MYESVRNLLLAGLGAAVLTKDKVLELTRQFVEQGKMSSGEAEKMAEDLAEESRRQARAWSEKVEQGVGKAVEALRLASREELKSLEMRVRALEESLVILERRVPPAGPPDQTQD